MTIRNSILLAVLAFGCNAAEPDAASTADPKAQEALTTVRQLMPETATGAQAVGEGFPVFFVGLDGLQNYHGEKDVEALLQETNRRFYPVMQNDKVVSSVTLANVDGQWRPAAIGQAKRATQAQMLRRQFRTARAAEDDVYGQLEVPALHRAFMMHRTNGALFLTDLAENADSKARPAAAVFAELTEAARNVQTPRIPTLPEAERPNATNLRAPGEVVVRPEGSTMTEAGGQGIAPQR